MLSNPQKSLVKRAQRQAAVPEEEYRDMWRMVTGWEDCDTSTDPRLGDVHVDRMMGFLEAIFWRRVQEGALQPASKANAPFLKEGFWKNRNKAQSTSRDRYQKQRITTSIHELETKLQAAGYPMQKIIAIKRKLRYHDDWAVKSALHRTLMFLLKQTT